MHRYFTPATRETGSPPGSIGSGGSPFPTFRTPSCFPGGGNDVTAVGGGVSDDPGQLIIAVGWGFKCSINHIIAHFACVGLAVEMDGQRRAWISPSTSR